MNYKKAYENVTNEAIVYAQDKYGFTFDVANYIYNLGYKTTKEIEDYVNPSNAFFHDPFLFPDMKKIVEKINFAVNEKKKILIYGDYDVDGIGSTYILIKYFEEIGVAVDYFLPSRYKDGYGLTVGSIDKVIDLYNPDLIITVDCGITSVKEVEYLKQKGVDVIITDHHEPQDVLPDCLIIDCKLKNQPYPFKCLCGAGMALKLVQALSDEQTCKKYMTVCAISTISDIVELLDENRYIVKEGLKNYNQDCPDGLKYLIKQCKIFGVPSAKDISFKVAPKLNATGRMGDASISLKLYLAKTEEEIKHFCKQTIQMNEERQMLCNTIFEQAVNMLDNSEDINNIIVLQNAEWECGILGIVSSKLVERYHKPTILLGFDERTQTLSGSARSYANFDLHKAISSTSDLLVTFGGHKFACGLSLKQENFDVFASKIQQTISDKEEAVEEESLYDIDLNPNQINRDFVDHLALLEPFGVANPEPLFRVKVSSITVSPMPSHFEHLIVELHNSTGVYFNNSKNIYTLSFNNKKHLYINLNKEYFLSKPLIKTFIKDVQSKDYLPFNSLICDGAYALTNMYNEIGRAKFYREYNQNKINKTVFVTYCKSDVKYYFDEVCYVNYVPSVNMKTLLVSPLKFNNLEDVEEIVFIDELPNFGLINYLNITYPNLKVYANVKKSNALKINKNDIERVFKELVNLKEDVFDEIYMFKKYFNKLNISFNTFICVFNLLLQSKHVEFDCVKFKINTEDVLSYNALLEACKKMNIVLE